MSNNTKLATKELPFNFGPLRGANANARIKGPCGDTMEFWLKVDNGKILIAKFTTDGCENSIYCGATVANIVTNMSSDDAYELTQDDVLVKIGHVPDEFKHCALLALNTVKKAIDEYRINNDQEKSQCDNNCKECTKDSCNSSNSHSDATDKTMKQKQKLHNIKHKIAIMSGKGGVGKSTVAVNLASMLSKAGYKVGLMDVDIHGPSIPTLLNLKDVNIQSDCNGINPIEVGNLKVISIGFFLENHNDALIWRGPMKIGIINQFLYEVNWGELDFLIIDLPPGTGDEPLSIGQSFSAQDGAIIVTTPQEVATADVRKSITFCHKLGLPIYGIIENMSGFVCPKCNEITNIFSTDGGQNLAQEFHLALLGKIPIDPSIVSACDTGTSYVDAYSNSNTAQIFKKIICMVLNYIDPNLKINLPE